VKNKEQQSQDMLRRAQSAQLFAQSAQMADEIRRRQALARMMEVPFYGDAEEPAMKPAKAEALPNLRLKRVPLRAVAPQALLPSRGCYVSRYAGCCGIRRPVCGPFRSARLHS
jgi:hypothetical protein